MSDILTCFISRQQIRHTEASQIVYPQIDIFYVRWCDKQVHNTLQIKQWTVTDPSHDVHDPDPSLTQSNIKCHPNGKQGARSNSMIEEQALCSDKF